MKPVSFRWSWDLDARLSHYAAELERKEHHVVDRTEIVTKVLDEFLKKEGY